VSQADSDGAAAPRATEADAAASATVGLDAAGGELPAGIADTARAAWGDLRGAVSERLHLVLLELRLAGLTLVQLIILSVIVAVLVVTAWLGLISGIVIAVASVFGLHWSLALGIGVVANLLVAYGLVRSMHKMVERVALPGTVRAIQGKPVAD
jgi:hypothetical protein